MNIYLILEILGLVVILGAVFYFSWKMVGLKETLVGCGAITVFILVAILTSYALAVGLLQAGLIK